MRSIRFFTHQKLGVYILYALAGALLILGMLSIAKTIYIKFTGQKVVATVCKVPTSCDSYNSISVEIANEIYEVSISMSDCQDKVYKVGQQVDLVKNDHFKELVWPESQIEYMPILFILLAIIGYFSIKSKIRRAESQ